MDDFTHERWLPVPRYEGLYEVSDYGRVRSLRRKIGPRWYGGRMLKQSLRGPKSGLRPSVRLSSGNVATNWPVHRLVLLAFRGEPPVGKPSGCHEDDNPLNNRLTNLRWDSAKGNTADAIRNGRTRSSQTHCIRGHEFTLRNTWRDSRGHRWCRDCARIRRGPAENLRPEDRTHCPQGHEYTEANTCHSGGRRKCRACARQRARDRRATRKAARLAAAA